MSIFLKRLIDKNDILLITNKVIICKDKQTNQKKTKKNNQEVVKKEMKKITLIIRFYIFTSEHKLYSYFKKNKIYPYDNNIIKTKNKIIKSNGSILYLSNEFSKLINHCNNLTKEELSDINNAIESSYKYALIKSTNINK